MLLGLRGANYESYFSYDAATSSYISPPGLDVDLTYSASSGNWTLVYHSSGETLTFNTPAG